MLHACRPTILVSLFLFSHEGVSVHGTKFQCQSQCDWLIRRPRFTGRPILLTTCLMAPSPFQSFYSLQPWFCVMLVNGSQCALVLLAFLPLSPLFFLFFPAIHAYSVSVHVVTKNIDIVIYRMLYTIIVIKGSSILQKQVWCIGVSVLFQVAMLFLAASFKLVFSSCRISH